MATISVSIPKTKGGSFLLEQPAPDHIYSPEDFTEDHRAIAKTTEDFWRKEVDPNLEAIWHHEPGMARKLMEKAASIGLLAVTAPEEYGGMELDLISQMIVAENFSRDGSFSGWYGAHAGIGTMPILLFGTEAQKRKYLPQLASAKMIGAYCLTEPHAGSDSLAAKTTAVLTEDGKHYVLNGVKMWITNGGQADLYTVFAKINGEKDKFTAFLVERAYEGVKPGAEEKKMGIKGSSTTAVFLDNVKVPVENVLGEIGRGHIIAFNVLNLGRLKLGPFAVGGSKQVIALSAKYAKERKAFGKSIAEFGMIQSKLAEMAIRTFAAESMSYRIAGMIEAQLEGWTPKQENAWGVYLKAVEEYAAECAMIKVFASEVLDYVVDEGVQIHGGNGYSAEYAVERAYRDSRINRIFEGTNEINRLLTTGTLLKRAMRGQLPLVGAVQKLMGELMAGPSFDEGDGGEWAPEIKLVANAKKAALLALGAAYQKYLDKIDGQQEVMAGIADMIMAAFAMESVTLRARKLDGFRKGETATAMAKVFAREQMDLIETTGRTVLAACGEGDTLRTSLMFLKRLTKYEPVNSIELRHQIAAKILAGEKYAF
jgi:alkylation response protein AidB-like acyl-CoA dehydrogenase